MSKITCDNEPPAAYKGTVPQRPDITYHYPLYITSLITGLSCPVKLKEYRALYSVWHRVYSIVLIVCVIGLTGFSAYGRFITLYKDLIQTVKIIDIIQQILLLISSCYAILNVIVAGPRQLNAYFSKLKKIDKRLCTTIDLKRKRIIYYIKFTAVHLAAFIVCTCDYLAWTYAVGQKTWICYSFRLYTFYLSLLIVFQINAFASALQTRFQILNERLLDCFKYRWVDTKEEYLGEILQHSKPVSVNILNLRCITCMHDLLCDLIDVLNGAYGFNVVFLVTTVIVNCVQALNVTLLSGTGYFIVYVEGAAGIIVAMNVCWAIVFLTMGTVVSWSCSSSSQEGQRTATLAFKLLNTVDADSNSRSEKQMREELFQLAQQVEHRKPTFSAAGFFEVNHAMLYAIMGAISSYIVIVIQFNNSPIPTHLNKDV